MIVQTKLYIPQVRNALVSRPQLMRKLDEGLRVKLTLISASAGYGKTTALSEWAKQSGCLVAWVSLDKQEDEWISFWSCVTASIQAKVPGYAGTVWPLLEKGPSASSVSAEPAVSAMLNELNALTDELVIVLDDYHAIEHPAIHKSLGYLLEHLPSRIHLYIASRADPDIPVARLMAKGEMNRITAQDLRFYPEEGAVFFRDKAGLSLSREQVETLYGQTEGWISGLQLAALTLRSSDNIAESIRQFSGHQHHISDYLLEEVFLRLSEEVRAFLLRTSILNRMNDSLCQAVTGRSDCQAQLEKLEHSNMFISPLDEQRTWYRYHPLLSDFLQTTFVRTAPEQWTRAHALAAEWLESHGFEDEAAEHYLNARQQEEVVRIIEKNLHAFLQKKANTLSRWILQLPESVLSKRPMVEMFYFSLLIGIRKWESAIPKIEQARIRYEAMQGSMDESEWKRLMGNICFLCASASYFQKDLQRVSEYFELAERFSPEGSFFESLGNNQYYGYDEFDDHLSYINDYHGAAALMSKWIQRWGNPHVHPSAAIFHASYSMALYEWNRIEEAEACIGRVLNANGRKPNPRSLLQIHVMASRIQQALGNSTRAAELLEQLKSRIESPDYERFMRKIEAEQACLAVRQGNMRHALDWLERCGMASADQVSLNGAAEQIAFARVLAACGRTEEAAALSERLQQLFWKEDRLRDRIKTVILQSVTLYRSGRTQEAEGLLETALRLAEPEGFIRSFVDEGGVMAEMLSHYSKKRQSGHFSPETGVLPDYADRLLQALNRLQEEGSGVPSRVKVRCFGRFKVLTGPANGDEAKWRTSKTKELMAYLVHLRGEPVDKYRIIEHLWDAMDADRASAQLHTTIHYLRKDLAKLGLAGIVHYSFGYYRMDMNRLDCDYDAFLQRVTAGIPIRIGEMKNYAADLTNVYRTGYMEDSAYSWAEQTRDRLVNEYVSLLLQIHEHYVREHDYPAAAELLRKALACDPLNESVHTKLIRVFVLADDRVAAMKQYDSLRKMLHAEFGVEPGEAAKQLLTVM